MNVAFSIKCREVLSAGGEMRVLIVDDHEDNRAVLAKLVQRCGHEPMLAEDGFAALGLAAQSPPDLVLMDIMMPGIDGYETAKRLRSRLGPVLVFAVSAS